MEFKSLNNFERGLPKEHSCEVLLKLVLWLRRRWCLKLNVNDRRRTDDGRQTEWSKLLTLTLWLTGDLYKNIETLMFVGCSRVTSKQLYLLEIVFITVIYVIIDVRIYVICMLITLTLSYLISTDSKVSLIFSISRSNLGFRIYYNEIEIFCSNLYMYMYLIARNPCLSI